MLLGVKIHSLVLRLVGGAAFAATVSVPAHAQAAGKDTTEIATVKLQDGSAIQGRVVLETGDSVTVVSTTLGRLTFARSAVTSISPFESEAQSALAAVPTLGLSTARRVQWTRKVEVGVQYMSEIVQGKAGAVVGGSVGANLERSTVHSSVSIGLQANYQRQEPYPAASDDRMLTLTALRDLGSTYRLVIQTFAERNIPQEIDFRLTQHVGIGRTLVKSPRLKMFVAPGVTYAYANASEEAELAANGTVTASGAGVGFYESLALQLAPTIGVSQNLLWTEISGRRQYASSVTLSGRVTGGVGLNIVYNRRYDSDLIAPVRRTFGKLMVGLQLSR